MCFNSHKDSDSNSDSNGNRNTDQGTRFADSNLDTNNNYDSVSDSKIDIDNIKKALQSSSSDLLGLLPKCVCKFTHPRCGNVVDQGTCVTDILLSKTMEL